MSIRSSTRSPLPTQTTVTRPLNTAYQIDPSHGAYVSYSVQQTVTASIASGQSGQCSLVIALDQAMTQGVQTVAMSPGSQTFSLALALQGVQNMPCSLMGYVPPGFWVMLKTTTLIGAPVFSFLVGQEVLN